MDIKKLFISESETILQCMRKLDETGRKVIFVTDENVLKGIVTDGDIRRFIIKSGDLNESVKEVMEKTPITLAKRELNKAKSIFKEKYITAIPVVDKKNRIQDILFIDDIFGEDIKKSTPLEIPVVLMAGGKGSRLYPYTRILPKPLIPIGDTPIMERIINGFLSDGCKKFYITVNYKKNMIKAYFNELIRDYEIEYVDEDEPLGTAGSLYLLRNKLSDTFILSNCDILVDGDYKDMYDYHKSRNNAITIVTSVKNFIIPYGVLELDDQEGLKRIQEKPERNLLVNTGLYFVEPSVIEQIPSKEFYHFTDLIAKCLEEGMPIGVYPISENAWMDMGQFSELEEMQKRLGAYE